MIHHRVSNFYTQVSSNPRHFLYSFTLNAGLKSPVSSQLMIASGNAVRVPFIQLMNLLKDQITILDTEHLEDISL